MATQKKEIELLLSTVDVSGFVPMRHESQHILTAELMLPRVGIASKNVNSTIRLQDGIMDVRSFSWYRRVLFKDSVERRFALRFKLSESLSQAALRAAVRYIGSAMFGAAGSVVDGYAGGGLAGDVLSSPFAYAKKKLQQNADTEIMLEGGIDLTASELEGTLDIEVPLFCIKDVYSPAQSRSIAGERGEPRKLLVPEGERVGNVTVTLNVL